MFVETPPHPANNANKISTMETATAEKNGKTP
jgi:hypothetical protein